MSHGMWLWPNTSTSVSGNAASMRFSRPCFSPVSWVMAQRRPSSSQRAVSGISARSSGPSLLPHTQTSRREHSRSASNVARSTQSPACTTTSAASTSRHTWAGRSLARLGRWVSASSSREVVMAPFSRAG